MTALTEDQAHVISAYTGILMTPFAEYHRRLEEKMGRPIQTHELVSAKLQKEIKAAYLADFLALCPSKPE